MKVSIMGAALAASIILGQTGAADAAFTADELKCRGAIAKTSTKLSSAIEKTLLACHKSRDTKVPSEDCDSINDADNKGLVAKAEAALAASVGGAKDACIGLVPAELGFSACPAPCNGTVPSIGDFDDVADCLVCLIRTEGFAAIDAVMGYPAVPLGGIEAKCHSTIGKTHGKLLSTVLKTRTKCQNAAEKAGVEDTTACAALSDDAITVARQKGEDSILTACQPADFEDLDSCNVSSISGLQNCVMNDAEANAEDIFLYMYGDEPQGAFTWTQINTIFTDTCALSSCHNTVSNEGGLNLGGTPTQNYNELVNANTECDGTSFAKRVVAGNAATSFLMAKLDHTQDCEDGMPLLLDQLDTTTRNRIRLWITSGAPNN